MYIANACVVCKHKPADLVRGFNIGTFFAQSHLDRCWSPINEIGQFLLPHPLQRFVDLGGIDIPLDDVQNGHILPFLGGRADHDVGGMQQSSHDVEHGGAPHAGGLLFHGKRGVACHQEMAPRSGDQRGKQTDHVVVHIARVPEGGRRCRHHSRNQGINLAEIGIQNFQPFRSQFVQSSIVKHNNRVRIIDQSLESEDRVVRLHHHIRGLLLVGEHGVGRDDLL